MNVAIVALITFACGYGCSAARAFLWKRRYERAAGALTLAERYVMLLETNAGMLGRSVTSYDREGVARYSEISEFAPRIKS